MIFYKQSCRNIYQNKEERLIFCKLKDLLKNYHVENYYMNREPDRERIKEIRDYYIKSSKKSIDGVISSWEYKDKHLYIYDGIHRFTAAENLDMNILIKINNCTEDEMRQDFKRINLSVSLPYLYLQENSQLKRKVCEEVMKKMNETWPNNKSPSRNCQKQNYNRDVFVDSILANLEIDWEKEGLACSIFTSITAINEVAKKYIQENKIDTPKKCNYYRFWLMYLGHDEIRNRIQNSILI